MNVNKKIDRLKQWAGERMGAEVKTNVSDDFKALEVEMNLRQEGTEKLHQSMANYVKVISKRVEGDNKKEKTLPIAQLGAHLLQHADDFEHDSEYGQHLEAFGRAQERLARAQESYIVAASSSWLESLERSLNQMKEYQAARKKLEQRRLAYDASLAKMQKAKREDFRAEEELRAHKLKYEETEEDVCRRMMDIKDAEGESIVDLGAFMQAQLEYHERCRQALISLRDEWSVDQQHNHKSRPSRPTIKTRSRSNTVRSVDTDNSPIDDAPALEIRTHGFAQRTVSSRYAGSPVSEYSEGLKARPAFARSTTYDSRAEPRRDMSPVGAQALARVPSDSLMLQNGRSNLRHVTSERDVFADDSTHSTSSDISVGERSFSSVTSHGSGLGMPISAAKKRAPPPPPPSRATKPPPPPPPSKRTLII